VDVDRRQPDGQPRDDALARALGDAVHDETHVRRRPAHVERDRVREARLGRDASGADRSRGGA
jgi:hypothetical protein